MKLMLAAAMMALCELINITSAQTPGTKHLAVSIIVKDNDYNNYNYTYCSVMH